uniref:Uncharacterized protein n=1 Tax=Poecilia latipinna TaxID=48699 RepID=A0A3B3UUE0_9TELE
ICHILLKNVYTQDCMLMVLKAEGLGKRWRGGQVDHSETHTPSCRYKRIIILKMCRTACISTFPHMSTPTHVEMCTYTVQPDFSFVFLFFQTRKGIRPEDIYLYLSTNPE